MREDQFQVIVDLLKMIERNTRKKEDKPVSTIIHTDPPDSLHRLRQVFFAKLEAKTGWGRTELKKLFEDSIEEIFIKEKDDLDEGPPWQR